MSLVYLDSCVFIAVFEADHAIYQPARRLFDCLKALPTKQAVTSELTIAELLAPAKRSDALSFEAKHKLYFELFDEGEFIDLFPVTRTVLVETAILRASYPQRIPDAIHITSALSAGCRHVVSFDRDARRLPPPLAWVTPTPGAVNELLKILDG